MRLAILSLFILLASGLFFDATPLYAAHDGGLIPCHGPDCRACDLVVFGQRLLTWFIGTMASVIALIFAWGGMKMVMSAGNTEGVSEAKGMMTNSVIGFIILLGAWLIVDTVMKVVISKDSVVQSKLGTWNQIECVPMPERVAGGGGGVVVSPGAGGGKPTGTPGKVTALDINGDPIEIDLTQGQSDASLAAGYAKVNGSYADEINAVCQKTSSPIPNCSKVVTALIMRESSGEAGQTSSHAAGIMQLTPANGGRTCSASDSSCIESQITIGVQKLNNLYTNSAVGENLPNTLAAYNSGEATGANSSVSGKKPALAASSDCPGLRAYQCATNPGGLAETRVYVADICKALSLNGSGC